ncbi:hypothetical protein SAMN05421842_10310 [Clostridium uliginosum]|uniref:SdpI/YhfL protein family protein n=1 Tax=Clostridium uliginosum TaxID=119641 RepID=A0A1I1ISW5_9CLOT|nr:hypothetical protein SAMN05421842_10310 [Clostridium uliginosum]
MNFIGLVPVLTGVVYLIYSVLFKDKLNYHSRVYSIMREMTFIKLNEFLRLQLKFSILNSIYFIIYGILIILFNLNNMFIIVGLLGFYFINFLLMVESKKKGYIDYK